MLRLLPAALYKISHFWRIVKYNMGAVNCTDFSFFGIFKLFPLFG
jgi:hypothetical protein